MASRWSGSWQDWYTWPVRVCPICGTRTDARLCTRDRVLTIDEQDDDPLIGRTFADRYQILAELGAG